jgi:hypothetical protein
MEEAFHMAMYIIIKKVFVKVHCREILNRDGQLGFWQGKEEILIAAFFMWEHRSQ